MSVLSSTAVDIRCEKGVSAAKEQARTGALHQGLNPFAVVAVTTACSELARNTLVHGGGGVATVEEVAEAGRHGVRITFKDSGPGIADVERVLRGGYSTTHSMGKGLAGARRLVDDFVMNSQVGVGTAITIAKWARGDH